MEVFVGWVQTFSFQFAPRGWTLCRGQLLPISQNTALFSLIGTTYGGDGRTTFALPNFNGRTAIGQGQAPGTSINWQMGMLFGNDIHVLSLAEMPAHSHSGDWSSDNNGGLTATTSDAISNTPENGLVLGTTVPGPAAPDQPEKIYASLDANTVTLGGLNLGTASVSVGVSGGNNAFNIVQPSLGINYSIALQGIFPSRN